MSSEDAEVAEIINSSRNPVFQQLLPPFYERDVVVALHKLTQRVNSGSTYEQIQKYLYDFDEKYKLIFRNDGIDRDGRGLGLVFPQYIENKEVRLELEALDEAIIESRFRLSGQPPATQARSQLLESEIINKYNKYKRHYPLEGGKRKKRYSQRQLRLRLRSKRRKNKINKKRRSRRMF
jgi:hypothetical protein